MVVFGWVEAIANLGISIVLIDSYSYYSKELFLLKGAF